MNDSARALRGEPSGVEPLPKASVERAHECIEVLGRLVELFGQRRRQLAEEAGITDPQWEVLEEINTDHFMPSMFARRRESSPAAVSKLIRQLVDKGLVSVKVSRGDARHRDYALTARGRRVIESLKRARTQAIERVWLTFEDEALRGFASFGKELAERLDQLLTPSSARDVRSPAPEDIVSSGPSHHAPRNPSGARGGKES